MNFKYIPIINDMEIDTCDLYSRINITQIKSTLINGL